VSGAGLELEQAIGPTASSTAAAMDIHALSLNFGLPVVLLMSIGIFTFSVSRNGSDAQGWIVSTCHGFLDL
jgi:hypothetical protein